MSIQRQLSEALALKRPIRVYRSGLEDGWVDGFVVALGPEFFALEICDKAIRLDGYNCLRYRDVTELKTPAPHADLIEKVLAARHLKRSEYFPVDLTSLATILSTSGAAFPLVTIHLEEEDNICFIGRIVGIENNQVELVEVSPDGVWDDSATLYDLDEITRVDVGGAYENALHLVSSG